MLFYIVKKYGLTTFLSFIAILSTTPAYADVIWPALALVFRINTFRIITLGLGIEYIFLLIFTDFGIKKSILVVITMNAASAFIGAFALLAADYGWNFLMSNMFAFNLRSNAEIWISIFLMAVLINTAIESSMISSVFKYKMGGKGLAWLSLANSASVIVAAIELQNRFYYF